MSHFPRSILGAAIAAVLATPGIVWAQAADATLRGKAPASTAVTAKNVATGATRRTQANAEGYYTLAGLPPGTYRVDAGPGTETTVTVSVASTATLDLTAASGAVEAPDAPMQEVTVTGRRLKEVRTSEVGTTVSQHQIETVPQMTRNFLEFADTVPGVVFEVDGKRPHERSAAARRSKNGVNLYIDGVGQKGYVRSGVSGQAGDTQGNPFPQLAIGEYKVITSNYKAEYDQISSAAITALSALRHQRVQRRSVRHLHGRQLPRARRRANSPPAQDRIGEQGIRPRVRRTDHPGQAALLPDLRGQDAT